MLQFTSLAHLLTVEMLGEAYQRLRKDASPGVDGLTAQEYEQDLAWIAIAGRGLTAKVRFAEDCGPGHLL